MAADRIARRQFLKTGSIGMLMAGVGLKGSKATAGEEKIKLIYRTLGRTGLKIPVVSFGVMNSDSPDLIRRALDSGITLLDTAHGYLRGNSEKSIGNVIKERGGRERIHIATKVWLARDRQTGQFSAKDMGWAPAANADNFNKQLDLSLERLQTDYVDILYIHSCDTAAMVSYEPMMNAALAAKKAGKARFIGVSAHSQVPEVVRAAVDAGVYDVAEIGFNIWREDRAETEKAILYAKEHEMGIVAMKTQGGNGGEDAAGPVNHRAALKWVLSHEAVATAIPGMTTFDQLDLNLSVMADLELNDQEKKDLKLGQLTPSRLCQNCRSCVPGCPHGVEIPDLMRAYMYAQHYSNLSHAEWTLSMLPEESGLPACKRCTVCRADCVHGLPIAERIDVLKRQFA